MVYTSSHGCAVVLVIENHADIDPEALVSVAVPRTATHVLFDIVPRL